MVDSYLGEIKIFPFPYAPKGWALCDGSILQINKNQALFALLGKAYGGDGITTFGLPNLTGVTPIDGYRSSQYAFGQAGAAGQASVVLTTSQIPSHSHSFLATDQTANTPTPGNAALNPPQRNDLAAVKAIAGEVTPPNIYVNQTAPIVTLATSAISSTGGGAAHNNMQPSLVLNFCIATSGVYPTRPF